MYNKTGKLHSYHSLDFVSAKARLKDEPFVVDKYSVETEDYENINDLIARSVRTKTKFVPETDETAIYESDKDIASQILDNYNLSLKDDIETEQEESDGKQSDAKDPSPSVENGTETMQ